MARILLTGAFGNIGLLVLRILLRRGHRIMAFDLATKKNKKIAKKIIQNKNCRVVWGDITDEGKVFSLVHSQDIIIHLAAIIPPTSEKLVELAERVNVMGTRNILTAITSHPAKAHLVFVSSVAVLGAQPKNKIVTARDSFGKHGLSNYAKQKIKCEELIQKSSARWTILRFAASPPLVHTKIDPYIFSIPLENAFEFVHPKDAALAIANCVGNKQTYQKILLIGGGKPCQITYGKFIQQALQAIGIKMLPRQAFGRKPYYTSFMDTYQSQKILQFQRRTLQDYVKDVERNHVWQRLLVKLLHPLVRKQLLRTSPYYSQDIMFKI